MKMYKPVNISKNAFLFCKWGLAIILWSALFLKMESLVFIAFLILLFSAILKIEKAPMIFFYTNTFDKIIPSEKEVLDENAMRFAHILGSILTGISFLILHFIGGVGAYIFLGLVCLAKTAGALGFCTALKLHGCLMKNGTCCRLGGGKNE